MYLLNFVTVTQTAQCQFDVTVNDNEPAAGNNTNIIVDFLTKFYHLLLSLFDFMYFVQLFVQPLWLPTPTLVNV